MTSSPQLSWSWNGQPPSENTEPRHVAVPFLPQNSPLLQQSSPAGSPIMRRREEELMANMNLGIQKKKMKSKQGMSSPLTPRSTRKVEDEKMARRIRESYACLRHRAMHKRCPAECTERRIPKPLPVATERRQAQQQQYKGTKSPIISSPTLLSSPNTLRILQGIQNTRISSPQLPRVSPPAEQHQPANDSNYVYNAPDSWDMSGLSSSWGSTDTPWVEEPWNDLQSGLKWEDGSEKSGAEEEGSSPLQDIESWLGETTVGGARFTYNDDLSDMAHIQESTSQLLSDPSFHPVEESALSKLMKILITREQIERWMFDEQFNKLMRGFYVRVKIGEMNDQPVHRLGCVVEGRDNFFESGDFMDNGKGLVVHFGSSGSTLSQCQRCPTLHRRRESATSGCEMQRGTTSASCLPRWLRSWRWPTSSTANRA